MYAKVNIILIEGKSAALHKCDPPDHCTSWCRIRLFRGFHQRRKQAPNGEQ